MLGGGEARHCGIFWPYDDLLEWWPVPRALPSLNAIRAFEAAARLQSFSRAADELSVTQSAVSRQIQKLEAELGQNLFVRNGPRLKLTDGGREYYAVVQQGLGVIKRGTERLFRRGAAPVLTISTTPSFITHWLVPRVGDFERRHAGTSLHLNSSSTLVDFSVSAVDVGVRFGNGRWPNVAADLLVEDVVFPVCRADVARRLKRPGDLLNEPLLTEGPASDLWAHWFGAAGVPHAPPKPQRLSDDFNVQLQATMLGRGITLARGLLVADELREGRVVCPFPIAPPSPLQYYVVCHPERHGERGIAALREWLCETARATVADLPKLIERSPRHDRKTTA
jgi:LysR family glycine cleavage system transcriptional activator